MTSGQIDASPLGTEDIASTSSHPIDLRTETSAFKTSSNLYTPTLKRIAPYWYPYRTFAKERWRNREILELVSTEFRDRSVEYYRYALQSGVTRINGKVALPGTIVRNGDLIENVVHRHEPPVTSVPVKIVHRDEENEFIVIDKPGSIPVHPTGRYNKNSLVEILQNDFGIKKAYTVNRLDRLTSGCMIIALSPQRAKSLCAEFLNKTMKKEYIARCMGKFPEEEVVVEEPMLTVDRQMGLNIVHPDGKYAKTTFNRMFYDEVTNTSVLHCRPWTGRSHQIRVHLQYIGYPIANDPVYSDAKVWGKKRGRGGLSLVPSSERTAPTPPPAIFAPQADMAGILSTSTSVSSPLIPSTSSDPSTPVATPSASIPGTPAPEPLKRKLLPREDGTDIGIASPIPLSAEAVTVISRLRNMKDEAEDFSRWRDVVFRAKGALKTHHGRDLDAENGLEGAPVSTETPASATPITDGLATLSLSDPSAGAEASTNPLPSSTPGDTNDTVAEADIPPGPDSFCPECYLPLLPDPKPDNLFIFLHALRYTTSEWSFATDLPFWAEKGYLWEREVGEIPHESVDNVKVLQGSDFKGDGEVISEVVKDVVL